VRSARLARAWWRGALLLLAALWLPSTPADGPGIPHSDYDDLPGAKALAAAPGAPATTRGLAHSQPHDLAATFAALAQCRQAALPGEDCEVLRLNEEHVTTGAQIRARVPDSPHPLFLWHFRRGSVEVYLAGSIHVLKPSLYPLHPAFEAAFRDSDFLVLEVDLTRTPPEEIQRSTLAVARLPEGQTLRDVLDPALYERLDRRLAAYGSNAEQVRGDLPALVMNQLLIARLAALGYSAEYGLEAHFLRLRSNQQVLELESLDAQLQLMFGQPLALQIELLEEALDTEREVEPALADLLTAWLSGDDARLLELFEVQAGATPALRGYQTALLDDRNAAMAEVILRFFEQPGVGGRYFVLVGSAHLVGEQGIVSLLTRAGLEGERINAHKH
jgi:uncharacterized protein